MTQDLRLCAEQGPFQGGSVSALPLGEMLFSEFWSQVYICYFQRANRRAKNINGFNHFAVCLRLRFHFHGHLFRLNQSMFGKDWNSGICPPLCICFSTKKHQRRKHLENTIRDGRSTRVILIEKILFLQLLHGFKLFHLVSDFQNSFCFWCTTLPSAVRKIFRLQWEFQWENDQNQ